MDKNSLTYKALKNTTYNLVGYLWPFIFILFVTPLILLELGTKNYGIYIFVNTVISFIGLLDLGIGAGVTKHMSYYLGQKDRYQIQRLVHSANMLFLVIGSIGLIIMTVFSILSGYLLPDKFISYQIYSPLFFLAGIIFFFSTMSATFNGIFMATQRFDISNKIGMLSIAMTSLGMLAVVKLGGGLLSIFILQVFLSILISIIMYYKYKEILPDITYNFKWHKDEIMKCYRFGIVNFINNLGSSALLSLDRLIIPMFVGPTNLTYYSMPGNISSKIPGFANTISMSLFPTVSQLSGGESMDKIKFLYVRSLRLITIVSAAITITTISFSNKLLYIWLNSEFAIISGKILIILSVTNFLISMFGVLSNFLLGLGKLKILTIFSIGMAILNVVILFILLPKYGIVGAAYAYLLSVLPIIYILLYIEKKYFDLSNRIKYYIKQFSSIIFVSIILLIINAIIDKFLVVNMPTLILAGANSVLLYIIIFKILGFFEEEDWRDIEYYYHSILEKIGIRK